MLVMVGSAVLLFIADGLLFVKERADAIDIGGAGDLLGELVGGLLGGI